MIIIHCLTLHPGSDLKRVIVALAVHGWLSSKMAHWLIQAAGLIHA